MAKRIQRENISFSKAEIVVKHPAICLKNLNFQPKDPESLSLRSYGFGVQAYSNFLVVAFLIHSVLIESKKQNRVTKNRKTKKQTTKKKKKLKPS